MQSHMPYNQNLVSSAYTKVYISCGGLYSCMQFERKAKIIPSNTNADKFARSLEGTIRILTPHEETICLNVVPFL